MCLFIQTCVHRWVEFRYRRKALEDVKTNSFLLFTSLPPIWGLEGVLWHLHK